MGTPTRTHLEDLRGATRLVIDATVGVTDLVEKMHHTIQLRHPPLGASRAGATRGVTGLVYRSVRGVTRLVGRGLDAGLAPVGALLPEGASSATREHWVSAVNGVYGDHLERSGNPLAIRMSLRSGGRTIDPADPLAATGEPGGRLLVAIHGLCLDDLHWTRDGENPIEATAAARGYTVLHLRYNTGRPIADNGRDFAELLQRLHEHWPQPVQEITLVGHSMGGLVARSAAHHGGLARHAWLGSLRRMFFLGTPHHGAPLERGGQLLDYLMELSPYVAPFTRLGKARSAGIGDLRYGNVSGDEQAFVPLPEGVECFAIAASLARGRGRVADRLVGDGLVPVASALGRHADPARTLAIPVERQWVGREMGHLELLGRPEVYRQLGRWLAR